MLTRSVLREDVGKRLFGLGQESPGVSLGLEVEFIPQRGADHSIMPLFGENGTLAFLRAFAQRHRWREERNDYGIPYFRTSSGGLITFEPGGQIEYSSPAFGTGDDVLRDVRAVVEPLLAESCAEGITLVNAGLDPFNGPERAPMQLDTPRYANMARHFAAIGPAGARMMRQTAAVQVNIGLGADPLKRWRLLNSLVPALTAFFANSARYAGQDTGYASYRSETWRETDPSRTGVFFGVSPIDEYLDFALDAAAILPPFVSETFEAFERHLENASTDDWRAHLSTLFPDVTFELQKLSGQNQMTRGRHRNEFGHALHQPHDRRLPQRNPIHRPVSLSVNGTWLANNSAHEPLQRQGHDTRIGPNGDHRRLQRRALERG